MKTTVVIPNYNGRNYLQDCLTSLLEGSEVPAIIVVSLCLDISEVFKPLIGDRLIFSLLNRRQITEDSFTKELNFLHLKKESSRLIAQELEKNLKKTIMHKELGRQVSYQYLMRLEAYKLIKHLIGEKQYEGFKIWW